MTDPLHDPSHEVPICRDSSLSPRLNARLQHETATGGTQGSIPQSSAVDRNSDPANRGMAGAGVSGDCLHDCSHETGPCEVERLFPLLAPSFDEMIPPGCTYPCAVCCLPGRRVERVGAMCVVCAADTREWLA